MKKVTFSRFIRRHKIGLLAILAFAFLCGSAIGSSRAALTYFSEVYTAQVDVKDIGITLNENGKKVSYRDYTKRDDVWSEDTGELLTDMLKDAGDDQLVLGKKYPERLSVTNSGTIDEYVRVRVYTYWIDTATGEKVNTISPEFIDIHTLEESSPWILDPSATTHERVVLYYPTILSAGTTTEDFTDYIKIDDAVMTKVSEVQEGNTTVYKYAYDGYQFVLEAEADAVQTHNAQDAIKSSWGKDVAISDGVLSLR